MFNPKTGAKQVYTSITIGLVVDTNDPQQTGRLRIMVPSYGDRSDGPTSDIPWAAYIAPFGGTLNNDNATRGTEQKPSHGPITYGMWNIPKVGAAVAVTCIDGDPMSRIWLGCLQSEMLGHTLPHGRYSIDNGSEPDGPLNSQEQPIQPLYDNLTTAFTSRADNYEWRTRGADYSACAVNPQQYDIISQKADDKDVSFTSKDGKTVVIRQGYALSQIEPNITFPDTTGKNYDSQVYSWTTPGFHSISMDDRKENCRLKMRTSSGHQVILDDTNERIYINTAEGRNWIELDQDGNIDIYSTKRVSIRSESDINFSSDKTIRMHGKEGIHMYSGKEVRVQATEDIHVKTAQNLRVHSSQDTKIQADGELHAKSTGSNYIETAGDFNIKAVGLGKITSTDILHMTGKEIYETGEHIYHNGPVATLATDATPASELDAYWTNRVPSHEPWGRCVTLNDTTHDPKYSYDDPAMGTDDKVRNPNWRR